uniref:ATP synthase complex subunit 8 n=1 Tax=Taxoblenus sp. TaxID=2821556 RepID=A0A8A6C2Z7_9HYME|nr:ATP synthase F0 subunit 8 [Taxoblenus sinicus]
MPQMFPLNWIFLLIFFSLIFIFFNIMNYYSLKVFFHNSKNLKMFLSSNKTIWKW